MKDREQVIRCKTISRNALFSINQDQLEETKTPNSMSMKVVRELTRMPRITLNMMLPPPCFMVIVLCQGQKKTVLISIDMQKPQHFFQT